MGTPTICLITDRRRLAPSARTLRDELAVLEGFLEAALSAKLDLIQIRERDADAGDLVPVVTRLATAATNTTTRILVNDRADIALCAGAQGVHVGAAAAPITRVRSLHPAWIVGRSAHSDREVDGAAGADYIIFGTVFPSVSKPGASEAGLESLRSATARARVPVLAIGGMTPERAARCRDAGAEGVAAIGLFLPEGSAPGALGVERAVHALREVFPRSTP